MYEYDVLPRPILQALLVVAQRFASVVEPWAVTGSAGMALQGFSCSVNDLDLQTTERGAYEIGARLARFVVRPVAYVESPTIRSHWGEFSVGSVKVEVMGDVQTLDGEGAWVAASGAMPDVVSLVVGGHSIFVVDPRHEIRAYRRIGRAERADALERWLSATAEDGSTDIA